METCENCRFWTEAPVPVAENAPRFGLCRRRAPVPILVGHQAPKLAHLSPQPVIVAYFPQVIGSCGCGDFEADPDARGRPAGLDQIDLGKLDLAALDAEGEA